MGLKRNITPAQFSGASSCIKTHDVLVSDGGPAEFLWLMNHASEVVTTSFHRTSFSLIDEKILCRCKSQNAFENQQCPVKGTACSDSSVFQPKAVKLVVGEADNEKLTDFVIAPGRYQFMVVGAFLAAFFLFGQDFIICWAGKKMFGSILKRIWICVLIALAANLPLMLWKVDGNWLVLIVKAIVFCAVYFLLLVLFGFNKGEKATVSGLLRKFSGNRIHLKNC